ncbi:MAG: 50S ribosomal protein L24 [Planctomycetaceae bacterium]|nr:50S ribosomal protein L24 [Planctomycetaceae bacterium]
MRIRQGDLVQVVAGEDAGPTPHRVVKVLAGGKQLMVEGINRAYKHVKRGHPKSPQGGRLEVELPIDSSNVMLYCDACHRGVRVGVRYNDDGSKDRFCRKCQQALGNVAPPKARYAKS